MNAGYEFTLVATGKIEGRIRFDPWGKDCDFTNLNFLATNPRVLKGLTAGAIFPIG